MTKAKQLIVAAMFALASAPTGAAAPVNWIIGFDSSASIPPEEYARYPDIVRSAVLQYVAPGDTVALLRLDRRGVEVKRLSESLRQHTVEIAALYDRLCATRRRARGGNTDFEAVFAHLQMEQDVRAQLGDSGQREVVVFVSDGMPDPVKGKPPVQKPLDAQTPILFLAIHGGSEVALRTLLSKHERPADKHVLFYPIQIWSGEASALDQLYARQPDPGAVRALKNKSCAAQVGD